jgi:hypothetical protein
MHTEYDDIRSRIAESPTWFDEYAVPRYGKFHPRQLANIYAREGVLVEIVCQGCGHKFDVALSILNLSHDALTDYALDKKGEPIKTIADLIRAHRIHYGDPPNVRCCAAGPTMNSIPKRIIEYWKRDVPGDWERLPDLEIDLNDGWAGR